MTLLLVGYPQNRSNKLVQLLALNLDLPKRAGALDGCLIPETKKSIIYQIASYTPQLAGIPSQLYQGYLFILCSLDGQISLVTSKPSQLLALLAQKAENITLYLRSGPKNNTLKNKSLSGQLTQSEQHLLKLNYLKLPDCQMSYLASCLL